MLKSAAYLRLAINLVGVMVIIAGILDSWKYTRSRYLPASPHDVFGPEPVPIAWEMFLGLWLNSGAYMNHGQNKNPEGRNQKSEARGIAALPEYSSSRLLTSDTLRRGSSRRAAFTVTEILVTISIIAILMALLFPALARVLDTAAEIQCASNLRQIGVVLQEYSNENRGHYPLNCAFTYPMGGFRPPSEYPMQGSITIPAWGLAMLYYGSFGVVPGYGGPYDDMTDLRPGILSPTAKGISMIFSTQPGYISMANEIPPGFYNAQGLLTDWDFQAGYCYWVDRGTARNATNPDDKPQGYSYSYDLLALDRMRLHNSGPGGYLVNFSKWNYYNIDTVHMPAMTPQSNPGAILASDVALMADASGTVGRTSFGTNRNAELPASNHVDTNNHFLPDGVHELYNEGAVVWQPMNQVKVHYEQNGTYFAW